MPVSDLHPQYENKQYELRQLTDTLDGASSVKRSGSLYLPIPAAMYAASGKQPASGISTDNNEFKNGQQNVVSNAPWDHNIPAYSAYVQRARFPEITNLIHRGLVGIGTKQDCVIELPTQIDYLESNATRDGKTLEELFAYLVDQVLSKGRVELLVDIDATNGRCVLVPYIADSFINYRISEVNDREQFELGVFQYEKNTGEDEFSHDTETAHFVVRNKARDPENEGQMISVYNTQKYTNETADGNASVPLLRGNPLSFVPLTVINTNGLGIGHWVCPLTGVSDIAISIYQKDADMSNSEFLTCNPMLFVYGIDEDEAPTAIGSAVAYSTTNEQAKAEYVEPKGTSLSHMEKRIAALFDEAIQYGVSIIGKTPNSAEAADTVKMRQAGNSATIRTIIQAVANGLEEALQHCYMWETNTIDKSEEIQVNPNLELSEMSLTPQEQTALLQSFLNNAISHDTYLKRLQEGGIDLAGETVEGEQDLIINKVPVFNDEANDDADGGSPDDNENSSDGDN